MTEIIDKKSTVLVAVRRPGIVAAGRAALVCLSTVAALGLFSVPTYAHDHDHHDRDRRGRGWGGGGYYAPPPVVYAPPYYAPPPVVYGPSIGIRL